MPMPKPMHATKLMPKQPCTLSHQVNAAEFVTAMDVLLGEVPEEGGQLDALVTQMLEHPFGLLLATQVRS